MPSEETQNFRSRIRSPPRRRRRHWVAQEWPFNASSEICAILQGLHATKHRRMTALCLSIRMRMAARAIDPSEEDELPLDDTSSGSDAELQSPGGPSDSLDIC